MLQVATLEVISVAAAVPMQTTKTIPQDGRTLRASNCDPMKVESPDTEVPLAKAKPPPSRKTSSHGIFFSSIFQLMRASEICVTNFDTFDYFAIEKNQYFTQNLL